MPGTDDANPATGMYEERHPTSRHIKCVWQSLAMREERYLVPAVEYWDLWFARRPEGIELAGLIGPSLGHRWVASAIGEHSWGVQLLAHVVVPGVSKRQVLGLERPLPVERGRITIAGHRVPFPEYGELETLVDHLLELGVLRSDDDVRRVLSGDSEGYSERHWQRRVREATGITQKQIAQLSRAREAYALLQQGVTPAECAARCGFADQSHLTRSLSLLHGQTPARILAAR